MVFRFVTFFQSVFHLISESGDLCNKPKLPPEPDDLAKFRGVQISKKSTKVSKTHFLGITWILLAVCMHKIEAATPFTDAQNHQSSEPESQNPNGNLHLQGQGLGYRLPTHAQALLRIGHRYRVEGRIGHGVVGVLEGLSHAVNRAYLRDDHGELHDVSIHSLARFHEQHQDSSSLTESGQSHDQVIPGQSPIVINAIDVPEPMANHLSTGNFIHSSNSKTTLPTVPTLCYFDSR